jgi:predicted deacylase
MNKTIKNNQIVFGGHSIQAGTRKLINLDLASLFTGTTMSLPVHIIHGRYPGPTMFISAAIHGDELNGIEIIRRLLKQPALKRVFGTLLLVPMVNLYGVMEHSRYLPDRRDLNRSFPGSESGSMAARLAHVFMREIVSRCDYGIDLHTGAIGRANLPQIRANLDDPETDQLAQAFGVPVLINSSLRDGSLRAAATQHGLTMLLYEAGEALRLDEVSIRAGVRGIILALRSINMLPPSKRIIKRTDPFIARSSIWVRASASGLCLPRIKLGSRVAKDQELALIADPVTGHETKILASASGIIIGKSNQPMVHEGEALFHIGRFEEPADVANEIRSFNEDIENIAGGRLDPEPIT